MQLYRLARSAAALTLVALLVGGTAMSFTAPPNLQPTELLLVIRERPGWFLAAGIALAMVSLSDMFTVPALHLRLHRDGPLLVWLATGSAIVGDLLGVIARLAQTAVVPIATAGLPVSSAAASIVALDGLQETMNVAGFVLVSVSFTCFGVLMRRSFSRRLGWVAIFTGVSTAIGQLPGMIGFFYAANVGFIAWYVGLMVMFGPRRTRMSTKPFRASAATPPAPGSLSVG